MDVNDLTTDASKTGDDVHQVVAYVRSDIAQTLAPLKMMIAQPYRLLGTGDLLAVVSCFEAAAHVLINHIEGVVQPAPPPPPLVEDPAAEAAATLQSGSSAPQFVAPAPEAVTQVDETPNDLRPGDGPMALDPEVETAPAADPVIAEEPTPVDTSAPPPIITGDGSGLG